MDVCRRVFARCSPGRLFFKAVVLNCFQVLASRDGNEKQVYITGGNMSRVEHAGARAMGF